MLTTHTLLPLGAAIAVVGSLMWGVWQAAGQLHAIQRDIRERPTRDEVRAMLGQDQWTTEDMRLWIRVFRAQEQGLKIPDAQ